MLSVLKDQPWICATGIEGSGDNTAHFEPKSPKQSPEGNISKSKDNIYNLFFNEFSKEARVKLFINSNITFASFT